MHWEIKFRLGEFLAWTRRIFSQTFLGDTRKPKDLCAAYFPFYIFGKEAEKEEQAPRKELSARSCQVCRLIAGTLCIVLLGCGICCQDIAAGPG